MTVWVLRLPLSAQEEAHIAQRTALPLPFDGLPDLSNISSLLQARHLMKTLYPEEPPESISLRADRFWTSYSGLQREDIIAVPLADTVALAEVNGKYRYENGEHQIPVFWHKTNLPRKKFSKHKELFSGNALAEVTDKETRTAIREQLPHGYNRFVKLKWLLVVFFALGLVRIVTQMLR